MLFTSLCEFIGFAAVFMLGHEKVSEMAKEERENIAREMLFELSDEVKKIIIPVIVEKRELTEEEKKKIRDIKEKEEKELEEGNNLFL